MTAARAREDGARGVAVVAEPGWWAWWWSFPFSSIAFRAAALMSQEWPGRVVRTVGRSVDGAADLHVRRSVDTGPAGATTTWPIPVVVTLECHWSRRAHDGRAHETDKRSAFVNGEIYLEELVATLKEAGDRTVLEHDGVATTAADLLASTYRYARALDGLGIGRSDLVALHAPNSPDALAVRYAAHLRRRRHHVPAGAAGGAAACGAPGVHRAGPAHRVPRDRAPAPARRHRARRRGRLRRAGRTAAARPAGVRGVVGAAALPGPSRRPRRRHLLRRLHRRPKGQPPVVRDVHHHRHRPPTPHGGSSPTGRWPT